jgi:hypothetical protein
LLGGGGKANTNDRNNGQQQSRPVRHNGKPHPN